MYSNTDRKRRPSEFKPVIMAMLKDAEFCGGGIFQKEEFYMKKYDLTQDEINHMASKVYGAMNIKGGY